MEANYDSAKTNKLVTGFRQGFKLHYQGDQSAQKTSPNLKLRIGSLGDIWTKVMKEVKDKRFAGPYSLRYPTRATYNLP